MDVTKRFKKQNLTVLKTIGKGTYGNVYLCENRLSCNLSIVKDIELNGKIQDHRQDIANEVNILSSMRHPNIVRFYECFYTDNHVMISMEYATSGNLAEYMYQRYPKLIKQQEILFYFSQVLLGVNYIHNLNIIHRDLKAENILLTGKNGLLVKIGDFGISKMLARWWQATQRFNIGTCVERTIGKDSHISKTQQCIISPLFEEMENHVTTVKALLHHDGQVQVVSDINMLPHAHLGVISVRDSKVIAKKTSTVIGTPYYLAPELCEGKPYDTKSDIWALGCLLYEMCTHKRAFDSESLVGLVKAITNGSVHPIDLNVYERGMQDLIDAMLSILPEKRPCVKKVMGKTIMLPIIYTVFLDAGNDDMLLVRARKDFLQVALE